MLHIHFIKCIVEFDLISNRVRNLISAVNLGIMAELRTKTIYILNNLPDNCRR